MSNEELSKPLTEQDWETLASLLARLPAELDRLEPQLGNVQEMRDVVDHFEAYILDIVRPAASYEARGPDKVPDPGPTHAEAEIDTPALETLDAVP